MSFLSLYLSEKLGYAEAKSQWDSSALRGFG